MTDAASLSAITVVDTGVMATTAAPASILQQGGSGAAWPISSALTPLLGLSRVGDSELAQPGECAMPVEPPDSAALDGVSRRYGLSLSDADVASFWPVVNGLRAPRMMTVGKRFDEATVLRVAHAFEQAAGGSRHQAR